MSRVILYARFSPRKNADECESIETQVDRMTAYCKACNHEIIGEPLCDRDVSGKSMNNRPGLQQALDLACKHKAALMVYALSRLSRSVKDTIEISERLNKCGADLILLNENIDTSTAMGRAFFKIMAVLNELEREQISERTSDAMLRHQSAGRLMSSKPPYGSRVYKCNNKKLLAPHPDEQATIEIIKGHAASGMNPDQIVRQLTAHQIPSRGKKWHSSTVRRILQRAANS